MKLKAFTIAAAGLVSAPNAVAQDNQNSSPALEPNTQATKISADTHHCHLISSDPSTPDSETYVALVHKTDEGDISVGTADFELASTTQPGTLVFKPHETGGTALEFNDKTINIVTVNTHNGDCTFYHDGTAQKETIRTTGLSGVAPN